ncbi:mechanosensitive ion channel family protein [Vibrio sp. B1Z05]|uniref:mechanosensitive ion channel family protein n=1 Tax=Vibrio sp. B1Z05 TaxID=2654980 RepID=UPI00128C6E0C|nr:mechanosensitive ion channel domain-containing protein [Vibrio sp. B1Z05]MPW36087.1 mechanosensitive ion channel [Vibrio sp. B1Z05]
MEQQQTSGAWVSDHLGHLLIEFLSLFDITFDRHDFFADVSLILVTLLFSAVTYLVIHRFTGTFVNKSTHGYDYKIKRAIGLKRFHEKISLIVPYYLVMSSIELIIPKITILGQTINAFLEIGAAIIVLRALFSIFDITLLVLSTKQFGHRLPLHGMVQFFKLAFVALAVLLTISHILDRTPIYLISGVSVMAGMIAFVMKDTIMGFIAGIQLAANKMISTGEWIQLDNHNVDGTVQEVTLTTVKVKNWDNTIAMIPSQTLVSEPFINWYGVEETGARRIKRALFIDTESIDFLDNDMLERMQRFRLLKTHILRKQKEIEQYNKTLPEDADPINFRRLTNLGCFREYVASYLATHPAVIKDLTIVVRQLESNRFGLPIEIYCYVNKTSIKDYERAQADLFDHIYSILKEFDLRTVKPYASIGA